MLVKLPNLGEGADSGSVANVLVSPGDEIEKDQTIIEIESEKALVPVPSPAAGKVVSVSVKEGDAIAVGQPVLQLDSGESDSQEQEPDPKESDAPSRPAASQPAANSRAAAPRETPRVEFDENAPQPAASPTVRRIARQIGLDLRRVPAGGRGGRVELADLQEFIQRLIQASSSAPEGSSAKPDSSPPPSVDFSRWGPVRSEPVSELRAVISKRMVASKRTAPHVTQFEDVDITDLNALRKSHAAAWKETGAPLTLTVFAIRAVVETLKQHPIFNASLDEAAGRIVFKDYHHIGIAVDTEAGLMVPTLRNADKMSLREIAAGLTELAAKARDRKLTKADMQGGTFTISNQGGIGGAHFTPVINTPEAAILGIGRGRLQPAVVDGEIKPRLIMPISVSYDHRIIDGGAAARFTVDLAANFGQFTEDDLKL